MAAAAVVVAEDAVRVRAAVSPAAERHKAAAIAPSFGILRERVALWRGPFAWVILLSALAGSGWLLTDTCPSDLAFPFAGCIHFALIGCAGVVASLCFGTRRIPRTRLFPITAAGLCLFVLPSVSLALTTGHVTSATSAVLFCSIPTLMVLGSIWFGAGTARNGLAPSLAGLLGALLLFPFVLPHSLRGALCFAAIAGCCIAVAAASIRLHSALSDTPIPDAIALIGLAGAMVLGTYGFALGWPGLSVHLVGVELLRCVIFDLPLLWLTLWLVREVQPTRLSARFLITPLVTVVEGYALIRVLPDLRRIAALLLMSAAAALLLTHGSDETEEPSVLHLR